MRRSFVLLAACASASPPPKPAAKVTDTAKHDVKRIDVALGVTLEVLDFGGTGEPMILLAGLGNTAHVFDDFAPKLTDHHHVVAITRRGFGASSKPADGYEVATRVADDLAVADALKLPRAIWIGHSVAGDELTAIAGTHGDRVRALVYLDATNEHGPHLLEIIGDLPQGPPLPDDALHDPVLLNTRIAETVGVRLPIGETLASFAGDPLLPVAGDVGGKIIAGSAPQDFASVHAPALVFVAPPSAPERVIHHFERMSAAEQQKWRDGWPRFSKFLADSYADVRAHLAGAKVVELPDSHHYLFIAKTDDVLREIRAFTP